MKVLVLAYGVPYPPHSGARMRDFYLLRQLASRHQVTCVCLMEPSDTRDNLERLQDFGIKAFGFRDEPETLVRRTMALGRHVAAGRPLATLAFRNVKLYECVRQLTAAQTFDVVQIEHSLNVLYLDALAEGFRGRTILDLHNPGARQYQEMWRLALNPVERAGFLVKRQLFQHWEAKQAARFDAVLTVSQADADWLRAQNAALSVSVIENGVDTDALRMLPAPTHATRLLFVGTLGYPPNADAARWFCDTILPRIRAELPGVTVDIVGRAPGAEVRALAERRGVRVCADVASVEPFYAEASVVIVPLRAGGGTRLKILEAMAYGRAVVSTRIGCEGLDVTDGETIALADTPQAFAARVLELVRDFHTRHAMAQAARRLVEARYGWKQIGDKLFGVYDRLSQ